MTFKHSKRWYFFASLFAKLGAYAFCVCPPLIAAIVNFPIMITKNSDSTVSIAFIIAVVISLAVVLQAVIKAFKNNGLLAVAVILALVAGVLVCVYNMEKSTIEGLAWVAGCGAVGILIAIGLFKLHDVWNNLYQHCGEVYGVIETK